MGSNRRRMLSLGLVWLLAATGLRVTMLAPETCPPVTAERAREAAVAAVDWIARNQHPDGRYLYLYDREGGRIPDGYNVVRHAGTTMSVYQVVEAGADEYLETADRATGYMLDRLVPTGPEAVAWAEPDADPKLGAAALLAVSLVLRRRITGEDIHDDTLRRLGRFMVGQQAADGAMYDWWRRADGAPDPSLRSRYATGEALWAITLLHETLPGEGWDGAAWSTLDYLALERDAEEDLFPRPWPDQWAAYSLGAMADWGLDDHHLAYARELAAAFGVQVRWEAQRTGLATATHPPEPRGAGFGTVLEGLGSLRELATTDGRMADLVDPLSDRLACGASRLVSSQTGPGDVVGTEPDLEIGAWFRDGETRVDDQQHAASGLLEAVPVLIGAGR